MGDVGEVGEGKKGFKEGGGGRRGGRAGEEVTDAYNPEKGQAEALPRPSPTAGDGRGAGVQGQSKGPPSKRGGVEPRAGVDDKGMPREREEGRSDSPPYAAS